MMPKLSDKYRNKIPREKLQNPKQFIHMNNLNLYEFVLCL
jgi:hypothetical protein